MKRFTVALPILLTITLLFALPAEAQRGQHHGQDDRPGMMARADSMPGPMMGMMQGGMMRMMRGMHQRMMQNPMHRSRMMAFMLPALADTLGLSEQQRDQLQALKNEAMNQRQTHRQKMMADRKEFMALFEEGQPSSDQVRRHMMAMAEMRVDQRATLYEVAQQMRQVLTDEQRQMLDGLTPRQRMRQMMSHMPMMDMMQMMQSMHGSMMGGGMMGRGMMQQGNMKNMPMHQHRQNQ
jgi:hypothetical protein